MRDVPPLALYPWPVANDDAEKIQTILKRMDKTVLPTEAVPGGDLRILALGIKPSFFCNYALLTYPLEPVSLRGALEWVLGQQFDRRAISDVQWLSETIGRPTPEIFETHRGPYFD
jgi:hypothetical protein